jgi:TraX protein
MDAMQNTLYRYGNALNSHDIVKIVALALMVIDHIGFFIFPEQLTWRLWGRGAAPLFFFLLGYTSKLRHLGLLFIYGGILSFYNSVVYHTLKINILLSFVMVFKCIDYIPYQKWNRYYAILGFIIAVCADYWVNRVIEYGFSGVLFAYCGQMVKNHSPVFGIKRGCGFFILLCLVSYFIQQELIFQFQIDDLTMSQLLIVAAGLWLVMHYYQLKTFSYQGPGLAPLLFISRFSLHFYFIHYVLLIFWSRFF